MVNSPLICLISWGGPLGCHELRSVFQFGVLKQPIKVKEALIWTLCLRNPRRKARGSRTPDKKPPLLTILCDLFGMVSSRDTFKGCWWPPTIGDKKVTLNHLAEVFYIAPLQVTFRNREAVGTNFASFFMGKIAAVTHIPGQITIIPKPELTGFWKESLTKPPFGVTSAGWSL